MDSCRVDHTQNFNYKYYPPKLVELDGRQNTGNNYSGRHSGYSDASSISSKHQTGRYVFMWCIIIIIILLASFLMLGVISMTR